MDRIWQWAWDRYGARYSWAICGVLLPRCCWSTSCGRFSSSLSKESDRYVAAAVVTGIAVPVMAYVSFFPASRSSVVRSGGRPATRSTAGGTGGHVHLDRERRIPSDRVPACVGRTVDGRCRRDRGGDRVAAGPVRDPGCRIGNRRRAVGVHSFVEGALRPVRAAIAGDTGIGDSLPRSRPTFAAWSNCPCSRSRSFSPSSARCWRPCSIGPARSRCSPS